MKVTRYDKLLHYSCTFVYLLHIYFYFILLISGAVCVYTIRSCKRDEYARLSDKTIYYRLTVMIIFMLSYRMVFISVITNSASISISLPLFNVSLVCCRLYRSLNALCPLKQNSSLCALCVCACCVLSFVS